MSLLDTLAERQLAQAEARGELRGLAGEGRPLRLDDDRHVPEPLRAGYRLLKNAGFVPPEVELLGEIRSVETLLRKALEPAVRAEHRKRLALLQLRLGEARGGQLSPCLAQRA